MDARKDQGSILRQANSNKYAGNWAEAARLYREAAAMEATPSYRRVMIEAASECTSKIER